MLQLKKIYSPPENTLTEQTAEVIIKMDKDSVLADLQAGCHLAVQVLQDDFINSRFAVK